ncbi:MAG TPA: nucleotidyltransferase family protein, partial [Xanthobacteraceae bacterium]|nr:nucleotidyltransferase family protein [Xanthobacteraceae bacterium]
LVLAAGRSTRMGGPNKLLSDLGGKPLVRTTVVRVIASKARPIIVVTGHQRENVEAALKGLPLRFVHNPDFAEGLSTSVKAGITAVPEDADGAIVCLGDMPQVDGGTINKLLTAFDPEKGALIVMPTVDGKRGNPVVWSRRFFPELAALEGDVGARNLLANYPEGVAEVSLGDKAVLVDVDTPDALEAVRAELASAK